MPADKQAPPPAGAARPQAVAAESAFLKAFFGALAHAGAPRPSDATAARAGRAETAVGGRS